VNLATKYGASPRTEHRPNLVETNAGVPFHFVQQRITVEVAGSGTLVEGDDGENLGMFWN
jgi:hypothetical protein